jgi:amino acid transporter
VINSIIGAGIFGLPSRVFALAGTYSVVAYLVSAVAIVLVILCFAEVGSRFTSTGGPYLYARATFGPLIGFQVGWLLWLGRIAAFAAVVNLFVGYLGYFFPIGGAGTRAAVICGLISALAAANIGGVRLTAVVTNVLTVGKLVPLVVLIIVGVFFVDPERYSLAAPPSYGSFSQAALLLVFTFMGFEGASIPAGEMRDPGRHLPFALLTGFGVVTIVYVSVQLVCIGTLPDLARSERPLADATLRFLGAPGAALIATGAVVSIGGVCNALMFATPRLLFAMSENGQLPQIVSATNSRFRTPVVAIVLTAAVTLGLALFSTFISALTISAIVRLIAYASTCAALLALRRNHELPRPPFVVAVGPLIAIIAIGLSIWLISNSPWGEMRVAGIAVALGLVLYFVWGRSREARQASAAALS